MPGKTIRQTVEMAARPEDVYEALMDSRKHSRFTGGKCVISRKVGGKFSVFDGYAEGENLELVKGKKIVQSWRDTDFPRGRYSKVTFSLTRIRAGTRLTFVQTNVPADRVEDLRAGWTEYYWAPMKEMLER